MSNSEHDDTRERRWLKDLPFVPAPPLVRADRLWQFRKRSFPALRTSPVHQEPTILVFDSGLGGLTVYRELARALPDARFVYVADDAFFPYGAIEEDHLAQRVLSLMGELVEAHRPDLVVIACNTVSTLLMPDLRAHFPMPFVGIVPAIKPACAASLTRMISVLGTEGTIAREYTRTLIREFATDCEVKLVGSRHLASLAEAEMAGSSVADAEIAAEIAPCFVERAGRRTDTIVLACTHYPLLLARFEKLAPWPVRWLDPAPAVARRAVDLIGPAGSGKALMPQLVFTSGRTPKGALAEALSSFGFRAEREVAISNAAKDGSPG